MRAGRIWLLMLSGLFSLSAARGQEATAPALLPPATFAARLAAQRLTPVPLDPAVQRAEVREQRSEGRGWRSASGEQRTLTSYLASDLGVPPVPSFSLQPEYERAMTATWETSIDYIPFAFRGEAVFAAAGGWRARPSLGGE